MPIAAHRVAAAVLLVLALGLGTVAEAAEQRAIPQSREQIRLSFAPVVKETAPAVVNIYTTRVVEERSGLRLFDDPFFRRFFGEPFGGFGPRRQRRERSLGSGVILDRDGRVRSVEISA